MTSKVAQHFRRRPRRAFCDTNLDLSPSAFPTFLAWRAARRRCLGTGPAHIWQKVVVQCYDWTKAREHDEKFGEYPKLDLKKIKNISSLTLRLEFILINKIVEFRIEPNIFVIYNFFKDMFVQ